MKDSYKFLVKGENSKKNLTKMNAMHIMAAILLVVFCIMMLPFINEESWLIGACGFVSIVVLGLVFFGNAKLQLLPVNAVIRIVEAGLFVVIATRFYESQSLFFVVLYFAASFFMLLLLFMEYRLLKKSFVSFSNQGVVFPTITFDKKFEWSKLKNVIVKHNLLTLHLKDDSFIQETVAHNYNETELISFQNFVNKQLS